MPATSATVIEPIRKSLVVETTPERAFRVFTEQHGAWWPLATHHIGKTPPEAAVIEPRAGGRWYERAADGTICLWGHVQAWEPPHRLVLLWQIASDWAYDESFSTEIEVRFVALGPARTRIEFEHRQLERFGDRAAAQRETMDGGWGGIFDLYAACIGRE
jgi:uncharacterized protein YndB with AHSA1/START domain